MRLLLNMEISRVAWFGVHFSLPEGHEPTAKSVDEVRWVGLGWAYCF